MLARNTFLGIVLLVFMVLFGTTASLAQPFSCYSVYVYEGYCYCMVNQQSGWATCRHLAPGTCELEGHCGPGGGGCFLAGTLVETPDGPVPIELLEVGDAVMSASLDDTGNLTEDVLVPATVVTTFKSIECEYLLINGLIQVTESHPFYVNGEWTFAGDLKIGDELIQADGLPMMIDSIETLNRGVRVYNIEVDNTHTFLADGILVHNKPGNIQG